MEKPLLPASFLTECVRNKLMGLGEAIGNSQLCSFPLECSAAELIVSKALRWMRKPFTPLMGRENGKENATAFFLSIHYFVPAAAFKMGAGI